MDMRKHISELIILLDGVAILFIVTFHALFGQVDNPLFFLTRYLGFFGLSLFTFTAGYKLVFNHRDELEGKVFLGTYFFRRFIRLYKPYLGYTLLIFFPVLITYYIALNVFHLSFPGITQFFSAIYTANVFTILAFFTGDNPVTGHLWYLIALIYITAVCFTVMYFMDIRSLFILFFPFVIMSLWFLTITEYFALGIVPKTMVLVPFFIVGIYLAYNDTDNRAYTKTVAREFFPVAFLIIIVMSAFIPGTSGIAILVFFSSLLLPFFLCTSLVYLKKIAAVRTFLTFAGKYSFAIYLFHLPLILLILIRGVIDILHINFFFIPFILAVAAMYLSVIAYLIVRKCHLNFFIE
jgi:peptidoglycan/LPS O-acetylase OafA/YrhL